jgi:hypothetical protein
MTLLKNAPVVAVIGAVLVTALAMVVTGEYGFDAEKAGVFIVALVVIWAAKAMLTRGPGSGA